MVRHPHTAFTLIELLVVITIIVVLLALLTPALDKAIYEAEMAVCATNFHAIGRGATVYATEFKRNYPYREGMHRFNHWEAAMLTDGGNPGPNVPRNDELDERLPQMGYIEPKMYNDPLAPGKVDFSIGGTDVDTSIFLGMSLWAGYQYRMGGNPGLIKLGDRLTWEGLNENAPDRGVVRHRFEVLANDLDNINPNAPAIMDAHQDSDGLTVEWVVENKAEASEITPVTAAVKMTRSLWVTTRSAQRGAVDTNAAMVDGSVDRYRQVEWNDQRMVTLPIKNASDLGFRVYAPHP